MSSCEERRQTDRYDAQTGDISAKRQGKGENMKTELVSDGTDVVFPIALSRL